MASATKRRHDVAVSERSRPQGVHRTCTTGGFGSSPEVGYHKRYLHYCRYLIFFVIEENIEPNSEVSAWQVPRKGDKMSPSANEAARRECTGRVRPEGSVQVLFFLFKRGDLF